MRSHQESVEWNRKLFDVCRFESTFNEAASHRQPIHIRIVKMPVCTVCRNVHLKCQEYLDDFSQSNAQKV